MGDIEILAVGHMPDKLCSICRSKSAVALAIARSGLTYAAIGVCEDCRPIVERKVDKDPGMMN